MSPPALTIGLPVYNGARHLKQALESLLAQTHSDFELIVSDNASTDGTWEILGEFAQHDPRISLHRHSTNIGPVANFRRVLDLASGKYFMWAGADDEWDLRWAEVLLANFGPGTAISFGAVVVTDATGKIVRRCADFIYPKARLPRLLKYFWDNEFDGKANLIYGIYDRAALLSTGLPDAFAGLPLVDMHFVFSHAERGELVTDPSVCLYKRLSTAAPRTEPDSIVAACKRAHNLTGLTWSTVRYLATYPMLLSDPTAKLALYAVLPARFAKHVAVGLSGGLGAALRRASR